MISKDCKVEGCNRSSLFKDNGHNGFCWRHYQQMNKHGKILKRTKYDNNEYIDNGDCLEILLYLGRSEQKEAGRAKIDRDDYEKVKDYKWCLLKIGYAYTRTNTKKMIYLHQLIAGKKNGYDIDHINHNKLDNRKSNLRLVLHAQNIWNKKSKGCSFDKKNKKWISYITKNKKHIFLGRFCSEQDAISARKKAEQKYFGEFAYQYN